MMFIHICYVCYIYLKVLILSTNIYFCQYTLVLESLLFDFSASMVERAVRLLDKKICFDDLVPNVVKLMTRHPYERQKRSDNLNFRVFEATVVLKSYKDRLIDMFDANILFTRLCIEAENREMLKCGNALCLKPISVKGSQCESESNSRVI